MPKPRPTDKATVRLLLRHIAENKKGFNSGQMRVALQCADRLAAELDMYEVTLTPPVSAHSQATPTLDEQEETESLSPYVPKMTLEQAFGKIGGDNAADKSSV